MNLWSVPLHTSHTITIHNTQLFSSRRHRRRHRRRTSSTMAAAGLSPASVSAISAVSQSPFPKPLPISLLLRGGSFARSRKMERKTRTLTVCFILEKQRPVAGDGEAETGDSDGDGGGVSSSVSYDREVLAARIAEKVERKRSERFTYLVAAVMSSFGITSLAVMAIYYRFYWQLEGGEVPLTEMFGTFSLSVGAAVGMEFWARWAHKALWHASLWHMHESHHKPREGPFELNDVFVIINTVPAIALLSYGFFHKGLFPGLCFGAGLGITVFGMAYMFVHDGLVHKRFPVGPIANVPYFRKVAAAHQIHHSDKFDGVPYGLFLGPKELEEVGGVEELEKKIQRRIKLSKGS